jgi:hypothetical protein
MPVESVSILPRLVWDTLIGTVVSCLGGGGGSEDSCPAALAESSTAAAIIIPNLNIRISPGNKSKNVRLMAR